MLSTRSRASLFRRSDFRSLSATNFLILVNGVGIPARVIPGVIADKFGALNVIVPINWSLIVVAWTWLAVNSVTGLYVWTVFYGFNVAGLQCLIPPVTALLTPDMRFIGTRLGMVFATMGFRRTEWPAYRWCYSSSDERPFSWGANLVRCLFHGLRCCVDCSNDCEETGGCSEGRSSRGGGGGRGTECRW